MRFVLAVLLLAHGIAHLPGFLTSWRLASLEGMAYKTTLLSGTINVGDVGIRIIGVLWLLAAVGFVTAGIGTALVVSWWGTLTAGVASFSLVLGVLEWPEARIGVIVNLVILAYLGIATQIESLSPRQGR